MRKGRGGWAPAARTTGLVGTLALAVLLMPRAVGAQDFRWSESMASGDVLEVRGISGEIRAEVASGSQAEVVATKHGRESDFGEVEIRVERISDGYAVCAVYRPRHRGGDGCDTHWRDRDDDDDWDRGRDRDIRVSVDFVVRLPAGVELDASMVSGDVRATDLRSDVQAHSVSGDVYVSTTGVAWGSTVSGDVDVFMGSDDWDWLDFSTVSGDITVGLPPGIETRVDFDSLSGDLDSDFDVRVTNRRERRWVGMKLEGVIGSDTARRLTFKTVSGDVRLRRGR